MTTLLQNARGLFFLLYPLLVYVLHVRLSPRVLAVLLLLLYSAALLLAPRASGTLGGPGWLHAAPLALLTLAALADEQRLLSLQPALVSLTYLAMFAATLRSGPSMYERFGRLVDPDLPDVLVPYCRKVTIIWCAFFTANAAVVVILSYAAPLRWWALYTGVLSYVLIGALIGGEACFRRYRY